MAMQAAGRRASWAMGVIGAKVPRGGGFFAQRAEEGPGSLEQRARGLRDGRRGVTGPQVLWNCRLL